MSSEPRDAESPPESPKSPAATESPAGAVAAPPVAESPAGAVAAPPAAGSPAESPRSADEDDQDDEESSDEGEPSEPPAPAPPAAKAARDVPAAPEAGIPWTYLFLAANLVLVWALPLIPAQDLPQHLTYIRIFANYSSNDLLFREFYTLPSGFQPYDSVYLLLAWIARHSSVIVALRVALSVYVVLMFAGFDALSASIHGRGPGRRPLPTSVMASMLVWSSALAMGFLQYFLCVPLVLLTAAALIRGSEEDAPDWVVLGAVPAAMAVASMHLVAAGALAVFAGLHTLTGLGKPGFWRRATMTGVVLGSLVTALVLWRFWGGEVLGAKPRGIAFEEAWRNAQGFEFVNNMLEATWYDPPVTFNYLVWGTLGPYRITGLAVAAVAVLACVVLVFPIRTSDDLRPEARRYARTAGAFGLFTCLIPWGIQVPSEITWLNFRLIALAFAMLLPLVPPRWFSFARGRVALTGLALVFLGNYTAHAVGFNHEAAGAIRLLSRVPNREVLLSLVYRSRSSYFAKGIRLTHFLPMYFTVLDGGICSQFWAKYTEHLPIDYRPGKQPAQPDDWSPQNFDETKHLRDVTWVLLQRTTPDDPKGGQRDAARAEQKLSQRADLVDCDTGWCLYHVKPKS